jgi:hypothetical protein
VTITGGSLTYDTPLAVENFPGVTLNGLPQTVKANISPYTVTDARGSEQGWNLAVTATQFSDGGDNALPTGSLRMVDVPIPTPGAVLSGLVAPVPTPTLDPLDNGATQKLVTAAAAPMSGTGKWTFTPTTGALVLTVPPNAVPGTYTSTITTTLSTGP